MTGGFIRVSKPKIFKKNEIVKFKNDSATICVVKGVLSKIDTDEVVEDGNVFKVECDLKALVDTTVIEVFNSGIDGMIMKNPDIFKSLLDDTIKLVSEIGESLDL